MARADLRRWNSRSEQRRRLYRSLVPESERRLHQRPRQEHADGQWSVGFGSSRHFDQAQDNERRHESRIHHRHSGELRSDAPVPPDLFLVPGVWSDTGNANGLHPANNGPNFDATNYAYFGLHREATAANDPVIFVAPGGIGNLPWDFTRDSPFFDDLLALVDANLCIDDSRVFSTGFSFGAMMSYALSITRQTKLRAVVAMAAANYNLPGEPTDTNAAPIAYMGTTGMSDTTCPWVQRLATRGEVLRPSARQGQWLHDSLREQHPDNDGRQQEIRLLRLRRVQGGLSRQSVHVRWPAHPVERG